MRRQQKVALNAAVVYSMIDDKSSYIPMTSHSMLPTAEHMHFKPWR